MPALHCHTRRQSCIRPQSLGSCCCKKMNVLLSCSHRVVKCWTLSLSRMCCFGQRGLRKTDVEKCKGKCLKCTEILWRSSEGTEPVPQEKIEWQMSELCLHFFRRFSRMWFMFQVSMLKWDELHHSKTCFPSSSIKGFQWHSAVDGCSHTTTPSSFQGGTCHDFSW